jgi:hypothetical protein
MAKTAAASSGYIWEMNPQAGPSSSPARRCSEDLILKFQHCGVIIGKHQRLVYR